MTEFELELARFCKDLQAALAPDARSGRLYLNPRRLAFIARWAARAP